MKNNDFDTSELLSNLDKLKEKYSFNFEDDDTTPEIKDEPAYAADEEQAAESAPVAQIETEEPDFANPKDAASNNMSWLIDDQTSPVAEESEVDLAVEAEPETETESIIEIEPETQQTPEMETPWYLMTDDVSANNEPVQEQPAEAEVAESVEPPQVEEIPEEIEEAEVSQEIEEEENPLIEEDDEDDEFADLDDDDELIVIRHDEPKSKGVKSKSKKAEVKETDPQVEQDSSESNLFIPLGTESMAEATETSPQNNDVKSKESPFMDENSPFYVAFKDELSQDKNKKTEPSKTPKTSKLAKKTHEKEEKQPKNKKPLKKSVLNIIVGVVLAVALWACLFATDIILVSNWSAPIFCTVSEKYADGSKTYTGAFYQIQISVNEDGSVSRVSLPWFAKGPNGEK